MTKERAVAVALLLAFGGLAGCRPGYIMRVGVEHLRYVGSAHPISEEIERTADPDRRRRLEAVLAARDYAAEHGLEVGGSYLEVADTEGLATAYVVTAAHADRLEPYTWSYPIVGRIPYRGYFDPERARSFAASLEEEGLDTHIVEASGYSTLGWFDDPLPSGVLANDEVEVVTVVLHELVHQTVFVTGNIAFNETLASAVGGRLAIQFFEERGDDERARVARERYDRWLAQGELLDDLVVRLEAYFDRSRDFDAAAMRAGRAEIYEDALQGLRDVRLVGDDDGDDVAARINNAVLLAVYRYRRRARLFDEYLGRFSNVSEAMDELGASLDAHDDPYDALTGAVRTGACCSRTVAMFSLVESGVCGAATRSESQI